MRPQGIQLFLTLGFGLISHALYVRPNTGQIDVVLRINQSTSEKSMEVWEPGLFKIIYRSCNASIHAGKTSSFPISFNVDSHGEGTLTVGTDVHEIHENIGQSGCGRIESPIEFIVACRVGVPQDVDIKEIESNHDTSCSTTHNLELSRVHEKLVSVAGADHRLSVATNETKRIMKPRTANVVAFSLMTRNRINCKNPTSNHYLFDVQTNLGEGHCLHTQCQVGSLQIDEAGECPDGQVQISYWQYPDCTGNWYGYGYTSRNTCRNLWTDGWKFKAIHLRCAKQSEDCVSKGTCTYDPEPAQAVC